VKKQDFKDGPLMGGTKKDRGLNIKNRT
jgi:hypothetical protein